MFNIAQFETKIFSQFGEDGVTLALQDVLCPPKAFLEIGAGNGTENCTRVLQEIHGWTGIWVDADPNNIPNNLPHGVRWICSQVNLSNVAWIIGMMPQYFGVLSLDIDGNDYHVWKALCGGKYGLRPYICIIETQIQHPEDKPFIMPYDPAHWWDHKSLDVGANLTAMKALGNEMGYTYIGTPTNSVNAFFVRDEFLGAL